MKFSFTHSQILVQRSVYCCEEIVFLLSVLYTYPNIKMSEDLNELKQKLAELQAQLGEERRKNSELSQPSASASTSSAPSPQPPQVHQPVYVATSRRLEQFRDHPQKSNDPTVLEWIEDVRCQLSLRGLKGKDQAAFVVDHLGGRARQEILGRGDAVKTDASKIFTVLIKVFGDGDNLPALQQKFFSYTQKDGVSVLHCSLEILDLFNRMCHHDSSLEASRQAALKGRLAEAVRDESLKRELRRLNLDAPGLDFFEMRDRAIQWLGIPNPNAAKPTVVQEVNATSEVLQLLKQQTEQLTKQQSQIDMLVSQMKSGGGRNSNQQRGPRGPRTCFRCRSEDHMIKDCPHPADYRRPTSNRANTSQETTNNNTSAPQSNSRATVQSTQPGQDF